MTTSASGPLEIDAATYSLLGGTRLVVELTGHWLQAAADTDRVEPAELLIEFDGTARGFAQIAPSAFEELLGDAGYSASFVVPAEAESRLGRATLRLGSGRVVVVPPAMWVPSAAPGPLDGEDADLAPHPLIRPPLPKPPEPRAHARSTRLPGGEPDRPPRPTGRSRAAVTDSAAEALRAELTERVSEETRLRRTVGELRRQLEGRARNQERLDATLEQLRAAIETLREGVEAESQRRAELKLERDAALRELAERDAELASVIVARDTATAEVAELRNELERVGPDLDAAEADDGERGVEEAEALLAEARRLTERLRAPTGEAAVGADG